MDSDEFRTILSNSAVDIWSLIDTAIAVALSDYKQELVARRDGIVQKLYACRNCGDQVNRRQNVVERVMQVHNQDKLKHSPYTPQSVHRDDEVRIENDDDGELDPYGGLLDDEEAQILRIKEQIEGPHQTEDSVIQLLQGLADMDITFKGLKETDIGRYVNRLRKHHSDEVKRLVKQLVRKWKDLVDEWVKLNPPEIQSSTITDGSSGSERNNSEPEYKPKSIPRREAPAKSSYRPTPLSAPVPPPNRPHKETAIDPDRLASARKRLHENYQEAQNAKKQRTIQVMDIHEIPKPKNGYISKNRGGFHGRNHR
ncbi:putative mediator of RNA polymerase II transcription subunit 26c isoform X2 [Apium graveolens]|uniref:putative mediator of RNA polymerase II transcription subunit 26c isoform X2 n=1 Tax=Apium graveolens TaxID=4045 RepID=UPI003D7BC7CF